jgi:F-type H+-transporting ATPase subunit alpha
VDFSDLTTVLAQELRTWEAKAAVHQRGFVTTVGDSVANIYGLDKALYGELVAFESGATGIVLNVVEQGVGVVILSGADTVKEGEEVRGTARVVSVPVGPSLIGRVVDPLGQPIDGGTPIESTVWLPVESPAPPVIDRDSVNTPLQTGILSIDAMVPIGRGQRELIIGDRQTGKTSIALDAIINQKETGVLCIYCAIGQKASSVAAIVQTLKQYQALAYSFVVLASASDSAALQYLAPYSAVAMAEYFMHNGRDVLIIYDDLSKHAVAYRAISLLLRRPPGREAFPGDVFYLHSRLLERAAKLSQEKGGGSITALPIIETQAGDISAYIPTNVISITDGQIFLDSELFNAGFRPAIDVGLSVSRVGGAAQTKAIRKNSGRLRLDLAQYREMAAFAQFGSDLDKATQERLAQGERLMEMLKQPQASPRSVAEQTVMLFTAINGFLLDIPTAQVSAFLADLIAYMHQNQTDIMTTIQKTGAMTPDLETKLRKIIENYEKVNNQGA